MDTEAGAGPTAGAVARWHERAAGSDVVLLDGFHAVKHAVRFGAGVPVALAADKPAALALADDLAPDVRAALDALLREVPAEVLRGLVPRVHPTGVAALAVRPSRAANLAALGVAGRAPDLPGAPGPAGAPTAATGTAARAPRTAPVVVLDEPRNLGNAGAVIRLAAGFGAAGVVTTGPLDPWHPTVVRGAAGLHFATAVERLDVADLPPGPVFALDAKGEDIRGLTLPDDAVLAFGSERSGLSAALRDRADALVSLPMRPQVSSYNLATSVGMALFHWSCGGTGRV
ncbi:TrmH family RNA methyltransferase [Streptomyces sp. NPDC060194]|uniref:TrmH family RNA methyltransferase n=1 Tax=Streptomyces sp. NPDC060194 TaxID=3347069 RepID=UPI0036646A29